MGNGKCQEFKIELPNKHLPVSPEKYFLLTCVYFRTLWIQLPSCHVWISQIYIIFKLNHTEFYCYEGKLNVLLNDISKVFKKNVITLLVTVLIARVGEALPEIIHSIPKESESML